MTSNQTMSTRELTPGVFAGIEERHRSRTANAEAAFLLPHLRPGMSLLDVGCGPGSITVGLAAAVAPGRVVGIDIDDRRVEQATALAAERGVDNVTFEVGDATALRFEDETFDAVFEHTVLLHLTNPEKCVREVLRVLKPGGVFGASDGDISGVVTNADEIVLRSLDLAHRWRAQHGADMRFGKRERTVLIEGGFSNVTATASFENSGTDEDVRKAADRWKRGIQTPELIAFAQQEGLADQRFFDEAVAALDRFASMPGAFFALPHVQAIGWKPSG